MGKDRGKNMSKLRSSKRARMPKPADGTSNPSRLSEVSKRWSLDPYPDHLQIRCHPALRYYNGDTASKNYSWRTKITGYPCRIIDRYIEDNQEGTRCSWRFHPMKKMRI
jgi:hypothetical protein